MTIRAASAVLIRERVLSVDGVADLHAGTFGEIATHLPGRRVNGVRVGRSGVEIHVVTYLDVDVAGVARNVRAAAVSAAPGAIGYTVVVEDVVARQDIRVAVPDTGRGTSTETSQS